MAAWRKEEVDVARQRPEKREATRLGNLLSQMGVYVCIFIKLHITAQSGLVILVIICNSR